MGLLWGIIGILLICILLLIIKISTLRKSADEIAEGFRRSLATDTNTLIDISSRDRHMRKLAGELNVQLRLLRKQRNQYLNGDREAQLFFLHLAANRLFRLSTIKSGVRF